MIGLAGASTTIVSPWHIVRNDGAGGCEPPAHLYADKHTRIPFDPDVAANLDRRYYGMVVWRDWRIARLITVGTVIVYSLT
ncbi:hypothetical protein SAMN05216348_11518 [Olsenella sp. KH3B4]|nr:hypothetical protein SAMN05216348_11518 [Olsenella sp. KH3B4]